MLLPTSMMRRGSTLAWLGTAMLIATAPYVAHATLEDLGVTHPTVTNPTVTLPTDALPTDEIEAIDAAVDAVVDAGERAEDATAPSSDAEIAGPRLPNGEPPPPPDLAGDAGGCSCRSFSSPSVSFASSTHAAMLGTVLALALFTRRR